MIDLEVKTLRITDVRGRPGYEARDQWLVELDFDNGQGMKYAVRPHPDKPNKPMPMPTLKDINEHLADKYNLDWSWLRNRAPDHPVFTEAPLLDYTRKEGHPGLVMGDDGFVNEASGAPKETA